MVDRSKIGMKFIYFYAHNKPLTVKTAASEDGAMSHWLPFMFKIKSELEKLPLVE